MNEKTIIESKRSKAFLLPILIGIVLIVLAVVLRMAKPLTYTSTSSYYSSVQGKYVYNTRDYSEPLIPALFTPHYWHGDLYNTALGVSVYLGIFLLLIGVILWLAYRKVALTVTDKRVFGTAAWGKRVDLPFDMISSVATGAVGGVAVATSSGKISFKGIKNNKDIHAEISKLLLERQDKKAASVQNGPAPSAADELSKLNDLYEKGVITKEEFDAKKKQLLGL